MSQGVTTKNLTRGSLRGHEDARTVLLRMALDDGRAERIHNLKQAHPELTWFDIADKVGVTERSAIDWQKTGGISHENCKRLASVFDVDADWLWSGAEKGSTPDLMASLRGDAAQLDRIEALLVEILDRLSNPQTPAEVAEQAALRKQEQRRAAEAARRGKKGSDRAA